MHLVTVAKSQTCMMASGQGTVGVVMSSHLG
jgi:hypothetical protein